MWPSQKKLLQKFGDKVVAVDGTHGLNKYNFLLQTMLVLDYDGEGFPVAFAISNRNDKVMLDVFLSILKENVGIVKPETLMTDMQESYYNSWIEIMQIPLFRLFCTWHFRDALRKNQSKIANNEKRKAVMKRVYEMASELDEIKFLEKLHAFLNDDDKDIFEFKNYFLKEYAKNEDTIKCWAYC